MLKAAGIQGRGLTRHEEVWPVARYNNRGVHRRFLPGFAQGVSSEYLRMAVCSGRLPIPRFKEVERLGSDRVGRISNCIGYSFDEGGNWGWAKEL